MPIIIAEDNKFARESYVDYAKYICNVEVDAVSNGQDLINKVREGGYFLIITDNDMPVRSGLEAISEIRKFNSSVPICMISADEREKVEPEAIERGATNYIDKDDDKFSECLGEVINKYKDL